MDIIGPGVTLTQTPQQKKYCPERNARGPQPRLAPCVEKGYDRTLPLAEGSLVASHGQGDLALRGLRLCVKGEHRHRTTDRGTFRWYPVHRRGIPRWWI